MLDRPHVDLGTMLLPAEHDVVRHRGNPVFPAADADRRASRSISIRCAADRNNPRRWYSTRPPRIVLAAADCDFRADSAGPLDFHDLVRRSRAASAGGGGAHPCRRRTDC
jgi:hypothetical protein